MMKLALALAALMALPAAAQDAPATTLSGSGPTVQLPQVAGATADPTCANRPELARIAYCIATTQAGMQTVADVYTADFEGQGWLVGAGDDNLIIYIRRKEGGGCEAFQMQAFAPDGAVQAPGAPAYLAFATIPGDVCAATPAPAGS
jgi:hypothetical protein